MAARFEITDGYVGAMGKSWKDATDESVNAAITAAAAFNKKPESAIREALEAGMQVNIAESPNFHYDHSYGMIRLIDWRIASGKKPVVEQMVKCTCGHTIAKSSVMSASLGSSCPSCYDRMSN